MDSAATPPNPKPILVLGLGNDVITDDAIGLLVARAARDQFANHPLVEVVDCCEMGLSLLDYIVGHESLLVVDSVATGKVAPGEVHEVGEHDLKTLPGMSPHFLGVGEVLALGRTLGMPMPHRVTILAIEVADASTLGTNLTPPLQQALPGIVARVSETVGNWANTRSQGS